MGAASDTATMLRQIMNAAGFKCFSRQRTVIETPYFKVKFIGQRSALAGAQFDYMIDLINYPALDPKEELNLLEWLAAMRCRLVPTGTMFHA